MGKGGIVGLVLGASVIAIIVLLFNRGDTKKVDIAAETQTIETQKTKERIFMSANKKRMDNAESESSKMFYSTQITKSQEKIEELTEKQKKLNEAERLNTERIEKNDKALYEAAEIKGNQLSAEQKLEAKQKEFDKNWDNF